VTEVHERPAASAPAKKRDYRQIELFGRTRAAPGEIGTPTAASWWCTDRSCWRMRSWRLESAWRCAGWGCASAASALAGAVDAAPPADGSSARSGAARIAQAS